MGSIRFKAAFVPPTFIALNSHNRARTALLIVANEQRDIKLKGSKLNINCNNYTCLYYAYA